MAWDGPGEKYKDYQWLSGGLETARDATSTDSPSANFLTKQVLRSLAGPEKAQDSCGFPDEPVDRQGCNEGRMRLSDGRMSPDLWTGVI